jgi:hypothetical protein
VYFYGVSSLVDTKIYLQPLEDRSEANEWGLPSDIDSE